ncbi:ribosome biogenesis GTPase Der [Patescibacteria group bacterium]|nr:ribosome biogenesis GTPase Der [Patescibacteria group bacterium]MBU1672971.1 ribosome biogenesis GTPase Der [Patescibacteria group bacterium]MBU1962994.1 ribosome biogenesis GTPase Der [Patescibacteria group bacterium]
MKKKLPIVAICGRTNVGKSTLFNRLSETKKAITSPMPGTTRDLNYAEIAWGGKNFDLIDTGGLDVFDVKDLEKNIKLQIETALKKADLILFTIDGQENLVPQDKQIIRELVRQKKPVIIGINKIDNQQYRKKIDPAFERLGAKYSVPFSGHNGSGTGDLLDEIVKLLPQAKPREETEEYLKLAIVGRPNVGKSSLLNSILGEEKVVVSEIPHTTRDINDIEFTYKDKDYLLIDTAGIRKKAKVGKWKDKRVSAIEKEAVGSSLYAIKNADVVFLVLEAQKRLSDQDKKISQLAVDNSRGLVIVVNKWDLIEDKTEKTYNEYIKYFHQNLPWLAWAPMIFISALERQRVHEILELAQEVYEHQSKEVPQEELDQLLAMVIGKYRPKQKQTITFGQKKKRLMIDTLEQIDVNPPTFRLITPKPKNMPKAFPRLIEKHLREKYDFLGTAIKIFIEESE